MTITMTDIEGLTDALAPVIRDCVAAGTAPLLKRINDLEKKTATEWADGQACRAGQVALLAGTAWRCVSDTVTPPGSSVAWSLCE